MPFPDPSDPQPDEKRKLWEPPKCDPPRNFYEGPATAYGQVTADIDANGNPIPLTAAQLRDLKKQAEDNATAKAQAEAARAAAYKCPRRCNNTQGTGPNGKVEAIIGKPGSANTPYTHKEAIDLTKLKLVLATIAPGVAAALPNRVIITHWRIDAEVSWKVFILCS